MKQTATMDLSVIHKNQGEAVGMQTRLTNNFQTHVYKINEAFQETDVKGNNNKLSSVKTETNNDLCSYNPTSPCRDVMHKSENKMGMDDTLFNYSSFKKAMDLRIRTPQSETIKRTIFEDADYFSKNYSYKLLPITFENVDESVIHTEHNYCHFSLESESETEEDCSRTMDYSQIKEKNYKKRKARLSQFTSSNKSGGSECEEERRNGNGSCPTEEEDCLGMVESDNSINRKCLEGNCFAEQAMDLSAPLVQDEKTDNRLREHEPRLVDKSETGKEDGSEFDSDKENLKSNLKLIEVTITRPDEKEDYQPCDLFLNDIARLVPRLIGKDCFEIDILDRTCDRYLDIDKHRLYYVISASTWRLFQSTKERVILTNDQSLGQPVQKAGRDERPTFLVFDQFSLAKCLADYCKEIGGCFEYTCIEESKEGGEEVHSGNEEEGGEEVEEKEGGEDEVVEAQAKDGEEPEVETNEVVKENGKSNNFGVQSSDIPHEVEVGEMEVEEKEEDRKGEEEGENLMVSKDLNEVQAVEGSKREKQIKQTTRDKTKEAVTEEKSDISKKKNQVSNKTGKNVKKDGGGEQEKISKGHPKSKAKVRGENSKAAGKVPAISQMRTRSKSTSNSKSPASQKSDKPKASQKRKRETPEGKLEETAKKLKTVQVSFPERKTRAGSKSSEEKKQSSERNKDGNAEDSRRTERIRKRKEGKESEGEINLRSRALTRSGAQKKQKAGKVLSRVRKK